MVTARHIMIGMKAVLVLMLLAFVLTAAKLHSNTTQSDSSVYLTPTADSAIVDTIQSRTTSSKPTLIIGSMTEVSEDHGTFIIMREAYTNLGYQVELLNLPYARSWYESNRGKIIDAELARTDEVISDGMIRIDVPYHSTSAVAYTNDPDYQPTEWEQLAGKRVDIVAGTNIIADRLGNIPWNPVITIKQGFRRLESGRSDVFVVPDDVAVGVLENMDLNASVYLVEPALERWELYHYIHNSHSDLVEPLTEQMSQILSREQAASR